MMYVYGMKMRGYSPGCQPKQGLIARQDDKTGEYWDILLYDRELTDKEVFDYELEFMEVCDGK